jgi:hypothetical protein
MLRAYITPRIGTGTKTDPIRSKASNYINVALGGRFWEYDNPARLYSFIIVDAPQTNHDALFADPEIDPLSEMFADKAEVLSGIEKTVDEFNPALYTEIKDRLELLGVNTNWIILSTKIREIYRYMLRTFTLAQWAYGTLDEEFLDFLRANIDTLGADLPINIRNKILNWMANKGLDTGWMTGTTTIRDIIHFILSNANFFLPVKVAGVDF